MAETHGLTDEGGDLSDIDLRHGFEIGFRVGIPMEDGALYTHRTSHVRGPRAELRHGNHRTMAAPSRPRAKLPHHGNQPQSAPDTPSVLNESADGRGYKFTVENVAMYLRASDG